MLLVVVSAVATGTLPGRTHAQSVPRGSGSLRGVVVTAAGPPVEGAQVMVVGTAIVAESNARGEFYLTAIAAGDQMLRVRRLGFRPESLRIAVVNGKTVQTSIAMEHVAISLATVTVRGKGAVSGPMEGFYRRRATGPGRFFTGEDIEQRNPSRLTDLLRSVPGLSVNSRSAQGSVRIRGSRCAPVIFLDGQSLGPAEFDLDAADPRSYDGIEVYSGSASIPAEFQRTYRVSSSCGTILLWSKRGEPRARAPRSSTMTPAALIARMLEEKSVFIGADVDTVARVDSSRLVIPPYPTSLFETAIQGRVLAEFVVSAAGEVDLQTFSAVTATHRAFAEAVRFALSEQRFIPASRAGRTVPQVMQLPFHFVPDSIAAQRRKR